MRSYIRQRIARLNSCLIRRTFIYFTLTSLIIGGIAAALLIVWTYQVQSHYFEQRSDEIREGFTESVAHALWQYDREQLEFLLQGILSQSDIGYARASDTISLNVEHGTRPYHSNIARIPLNYRDQNIGELELGFNERQILIDTLTSLIPYAITTLILLLALAATLVLVMHRVVTRRISRMADEAEARLNHGLHDPLAVETGPYGDEIDRLISSFNALNDRLLSELMRNTRSQQQLTVINAELEGRVEERTQHLSDTISRLNQTLDDLHTTQGKLIEAEKLSALGGMIAAIGHEVETPLGLCLTMESCLRNDVRMLEDTLGDKADDRTRQDLGAVTESLNMLRENLRRASELMASFKAVSAGQIADDSDWIKMRDTIEELLQALAPNLRDTHHKITVDCPAHLTMQVSPVAIQQILTNLIMNSLTHGLQNRADGEIHIRVGGDKDNVVILYTDNGTGLSEEAKTKIFEPLFTTRRGKGGTGLGMHLVYNIIRQRMKGDIVLEPTERGVAFRISMPKQKARRRSIARDAVY